MAYNMTDDSSINPLGPHDTLKHHFTSLKTDLIFLQQRVLERTPSRELRQQFAACSG